MATDSFDPRCERPATLVVPVRLDPEGLTGPTRSQARARRWVSCAPWWFVPRDRADCVEQRVLEQAARVGTRGGVTGWAALRWQGATYFDGSDDGGRTQLPVPLLVGPGLVEHPASVLSKSQFAPTERRVVGGITVAAPDRALFDDVVRLRGRLWRAAAAVDMACAAGLLTVETFGEYLVHRQAWTGVPFAREAVALASDDARSPREVWLRLAWVLSLGLPAPHVNQRVYDLDGRLIGMPDLLDEEAGLVVEYDGAYHRKAGQVRKDLDRETRFRDHGLEYVAVVTGDTVSDAARRISRARARARFLPAGSRAWRVSSPEGIVRREKHS